MEKQKLKDLFALVLDINDRGKHDVFLDLSPHINAIIVSVFIDKWDGEKCPVFREQFDYDKKSCLHDPKEFKKIMTYLNSLK